MCCSPRICRETKPPRDPHAHLFSTPQVTNASCTPSVPVQLASRVLQSTGGLSSGPFLDDEEFGPVFEGSGRSRDVLLVRVRQDRLHLKAIEFTSCRGRRSREEATGTPSVALVGTQF